MKSNSKRHIFASAVLIALSLLGGCASDTPEARSRSAGSYIDDRNITRRVSNGIEAASPQLADAHIDIDTFNGAVLLVGQIPTDELRQLAAQTAANVPNVRRVYNETTVGPDIGFAAHASDAVITSKVKSQLWAQESIKDSKMVVLTEEGVVYLMGIVSRNQADLAAQVAQKIDGVQKVVQLFEIIGESGAN